MIGKLKGTIDEIGDDYVLVDVHGVCYVAYCSARTLSKLGSAGEACVLFIETYVREDQLKLFGFQTQLEREWFVSRDLPHVTPAFPLASFRRTRAARCMGSRAS